MAFVGDITPNANGDSMLEVPKFVCGHYNEDDGDEPDLIDMVPGTRTSTLRFKGCVLKVTNIPIWRCPECDDFVYTRVSDYVLTKLRLNGTCSGEIDFSSITPEMLDGGGH